MKFIHVNQMVNAQSIANQLLAQYTTSIEVEVKYINIHTNLSNGAVMSHQIWRHLLFSNRAILYSDPQTTVNSTQPGLSATSVS